MSNTNLKEKAGEKAIKDNRIFDIFFPENIGYKKITEKKKQLSGVDYEIYLPNNETLYIDLKVGIGKDYSMKSGDYKNNVVLRKRTPAVAVEIYQYGKFTNVKGKMTDFFLYYIKDDFSEAFYLFDYDDIQQISEDNNNIMIYNETKDVYQFNRNPKAEYTMYKSFNGTGDYIKIEAEEYAKNFFIIGEENGENKS